MKVIMRLYRQHDLDLIYLYKLSNYSLPEAIKKAVRAYVTNIPHSIEVPHPSQDDKVTLPKRIQFHLVLSEECDREIIEWIATITRGYRNSVLKNLTRCYLPYPITIPYSESTQVQFETEYVKNIQKNIKQNLHKKPTDNTNGPVYDAKIIVDEILKAPILTEKTDAPLMKEGDDILTRKDNADT